MFGYTITFDAYRSCDIREFILLTQSKKAEKTEVGKRMNCKSLPLYTMWTAKCSFL